MKKILLFILLPIFCLSQKRIIDTVSSVNLSVNDSTISDWISVRINNAGNYIITHKDSSKTVCYINKTTSIQTAFGIMPANTSATQKEVILRQSGINLIRIPVFIQQQGFHSEYADQLLKDSFQVALNFDWNNSSTATYFPTDTTMIRYVANMFFSYYEPYKNQIPFVAVENEYNNINYHIGDIQNYLTELKIVSEVGHEYGFKIADAGLSGSGLQQYTYSQLSGDAAKQWALQYRVPYNSPNYKQQLQTISTYIIGIRDIDIDYLNIHWYEQDSCLNGFKTAFGLYKNDCDKPYLISNEFGIRGIYSDELLQQTISEVRSNVIYAILYSGNNANLISTDEMKLFLK